jgi:hypothetical protein
MGMSRVLIRVPVWNFNLRMNFVDLYQIGYWKPKLNVIKWTLFWHLFVQYKPYFYTNNREGFIKSVKRRRVILGFLIPQGRDWWPQFTIRTSKNQRFSPRKTETGIEISKQGLFWGRNKISIFHNGQKYLAFYGTKFMTVCLKHMSYSNGILSWIHFNMILQSFIFLYVTSVILHNSSKSEALPFLHPLQKTHPLSGLHDCLFNILELPSTLSRHCGNVYYSECSSFDSTPRY